MLNKQYVKNYRDKAERRLTVGQTTFIYRRVKQLVAYQTHILSVMGSSPISATISTFANSDKFMSYSITLIGCYNYNKVNTLAKGTYTFMVQSLHDC